MNRKIVIWLLTAALLSAVPFAQAQQPKKVPRIGYLSGQGPRLELRDEAFLQGMQELGYVEGKNISIEWRWAQGRTEQLSNLAADLVKLKVDVIVTTGTTTTTAIKQASKTIPIVMTTSSDPIQSGFVASLARPGGNITGLTSISPEVGGKRLELLKEIVPKISRVAVLLNPTAPGNQPQMKEIEVAADALGLQLQPLEVHRAEFAAAFRAASEGRASALVVLSSNRFLAERRQLVALAAANKLPAIYAEKEFVEAGGLMSYGTNLQDLYKRAATYVDKILKGAKPADLPVEQPMKFELVINLKTAKQIGMTIPQSVLYRADRVIK